MTNQKFYSLANEIFKSVLAEEGFLSASSQKATFYRKNDNDVYHIIYPNRLRDKSYYNVCVYATSPKIDPLFEEYFPDGLSIPSDTLSYLNEYGIGLPDDDFNCKYESNLERSFSKKVAPLLKSIALPYLNKIQTLENLFVTIKNPLPKAIASAVLNKGDAVELLKNEQKRLMEIENRNLVVERYMHHIFTLLEK